MSSRVQLAINVGDLPAAIAFYAKLFGTPPAKVREGYANFAVADPPLKLVLIAGEGAGGTINHLGIEVASPEEVKASAEYLAEHDLQTRVEEHVDCCYAVQDKVWVTDPDGARWEVYTVLSDSSAPAPACC